MVFFNESIDAKLMRSAKTQLKAQLFAKQARDPHSLLRATPIHTS